MRRTSDNRLGSCNAACGRYRRRHENGSLGRGAGHPSAELSLGSRGVMNRRTLSEMGPRNAVPSGTTKTLTGWLSMRLFPLFVMAVSCGCSDRLVEECAPLVPGVLVVDSIAPDGIDSIAAGEWTELWRVGGLREGQELAVPTNATVSPDGVLAIPDFQLQEVVFIGSDGTWLGPRFRKGRGPEEVAIPVAAVWAATGELSVFDLGGPKILKVDPQGNITSTIIPPSFVASILANGELHWAGIQPDGTVLLSPGWTPVERDEGLHLEGLILRLRPGADGPDTLVAREFPAISASRIGAYPAPGWARPVAAVGGDSSLVIGGFDEGYRVLVYGGSGEIVHQICGRGSPIPPTPAERGEVSGEGTEAISAALREAPPPSHPAAFGRLVASEDGFLWVQRDRPAPVPGQGSYYGRPGARYDVFDQAGRQVATAALPKSAYLLEAKGDTIWTFEIGTYDEVEVVAYQRVRPN